MGKTQVNLENLAEYRKELARWRRAAVSSILLYGCNVARGLRGRGFIEKLHQLTGAKVAASATRTGNKKLGGNWELETATHPMRMALAFEPRVMASYRGVFAQGDLDATFGTGGIVITAIGAGSSGYGTVVQSDGKIVMGQLVLQW